MSDDTAGWTRWLVTQVFVFVFLFFFAYVFSLSLSLSLSHTAAHSKIQSQCIRWHGWVIPLTSDPGRISPYWGPETTSCDWQMEEKWVEVEEMVEIAVNLVPSNPATRWLKIEKMFPASPLSQIKWFTRILGPCSFLNIKRYPSKSLRTGSRVSRTRIGGAETYNPFLVHYSPLSSISSKVLSTSSLSLYASSCDRPPARLRAFPLFTSLLPSSSLLTPASARAVSCFVQNLSLGTEILSKVCRILEPT